MTLSDLERQNARGHIFQADILNNARTEYNNFNFYTLNIVPTKLITLKNFLPVPVVWIMFAFYVNKNTDMS